MESLAIRFLAPGWLWLLVLPPAALWLGARGGAVLALVTGTLESWREAQRNRPAEVQRKRRVPPALWALAAALACAALALARPERVAAAAPRRFELVVDRSPSMYLVEGGRTRLERALEPVRDWISSSVRAADELVWIDSLHPEGRSARSVPADLLEAPRAARAEPDWARYDRAQALWVSDRPSPAPRLAGCSASGGAPVAGPIGREGSVRLDWDGERVLRVEQAYKPGELGCALDARLPALLREFAALWAERHGLELRATRDAANLLSIELESAGELRAVELARDGWSARARVGAALTPALGERTWLSAGGPCLVASPGRLRCSIAELAEPAGDPAAFAVSWGELLDSVLRDPPGVVPLAERTARGEALWRAPQGAAAEGRARPLSGWCALLAALLALGAWVLRGIRA